MLSGLRLQRWLLDTSLGARGFAARTADFTGFGTIVGIRRHLWIVTINGNGYDATGRAKPLAPTTINTMIMMNMAVTMMMTTIMNRSMKLMMHVMINMGMNMNMR